MKAVLMSIHPKWCELIASGKKTVEIRKNKPKLETPFKVYIYMTMDKCPKFVYDEKLEKQSVFERAQNLANGRVIGEFVCDKVEQGHILWVKEQPEYYDRVEEKTQLTYRQMFDYLGESGIGWFWHISNLVIYDKPKGVSDFRKHCNHKNDCFNDACFNCERYDYIGHRCYDDVVRPPKSWCYVEEQK